jgi:hypothetical protein
MSYGLSVFLMPDAESTRVFGCGDRELVEEVIRVMARQFASYDEQFDVVREGRIPTADALRELFAGEVTRPECGSHYRWAYEVYCMSIGDWLSNSTFCPCWSDWFVTLDQALARHAVPLRFTKLLDVPPTHLPETDDWPGVGHWTGDEMAAAAGPLAAAAAAEGDVEVAESLTEVLGWSRQTAARPGSLIVGFFG